MAAGVLAFGGLAACGDDDDTSDTTDTGGEETTDTGEETTDTGEETTDTGEETTDDGGEGSGEAQAYCDAVEAFVAEFDEGDPLESMDELTTLSEQATELLSSGISADDAELVTECSAELQTLTPSG